MSSLGMSVACRFSVCGENEVCSLATLGDAVCACSDGYSKNETGACIGEW